MWVVISKLHLKRGEAKFSCKYKESRVLLCIKYFVTHCFGSIQEVILQQDNVPKYSQHFARTILTPKKTTEDFTPQLHDLNPSEYLWGHLINERNRIHSSYHRTFFQTVVGWLGSSGFVEYISDHVHVIIKTTRRSYQILK